MKQTRYILLLLVVVTLLVPQVGYAQSYFFEMESLTVDYYINEDGTASIFITFVFNNNPAGSPIDFVDVGIPNPNFSESSISAQVNGLPVEYISRSEYQGQGNAGVAIYLGSNAIQPGESGTLIVFIESVERVLFPDSDDPGYSSTNYKTTYFGSQFVEGETAVTVNFHMPEGVLPEEPRWHAAPSGFPSEPETFVDESGRVVYSWTNLNAQPDRGYEFGASFPSNYVPVESISKPTISESVEDSFGIDPEAFSGFFMCLGGIGFVVLLVLGSYRSTQKRKLQYLSPKVAIEGHGIKRGLTAVEAAILLEQPMDKVLTMILFSVVKKEAASVVSNDPLELKIVDPLPDSIRPYEAKFLEAFKTKEKGARRKGLQAMMIDLVKGVSSSMKGFSRRETIAYYQDITNRAWAQVTASETPEVKMEKFSDNIEWTMLDRNYEDRTKDVFRTGPVIIPTWWHRYDPSVPSSSSSRPTISTTGGGGSSGGGISMPTLPGAAFAASMVQGVQNFSSNVVGNITEFTGGITNRTNPVPPPTRSSGSRSSGGGGSSCACACACAGCACACAGGGR